MRFLLISLMIALLPVRAWLGDAMAMTMVAGPSTAIEIAATNPNTERAGGTFSLHSELASLPCHEADAATTLASNSSSSNAPATHADCAQCSTCQVCHGVVMFSGVSQLPVLALPTQVAHSDQALFASVPRAPHLKPPIS